MYPHDNAAVIGALAVPREGADDPAFREIRRMRGRLISELIASFMCSLSKAARLAWRRLRDRRSTAMHDALPGLDDRALRDIGLRRIDLGTNLRDDWRMTA